MIINYETADITFDLHKHSQEATIQRAFEATLQLGHHAMRFAAIERAPQYVEGQHENDAEHSFMLALIAPELALLLRPELDCPLVTQFALVHDLVELETGDTITFVLSTSQLIRKEISEREAMGCLLERLPQHTASLVKRYENQQEPEARFVRLTDKLLPLIANIYGPGKRVMSESFGIENTDQLEATEAACSHRIRQTFIEEELATLHGVRDLLAQHFKNIFEEADSKK